MVGRFRDLAEAPRVQTQEAFDARILTWVKNEPARKKTTAPPAKTPFGSAEDRRLFKNLDDALADLAEVGE